jgi:hypothetical protein
VRGEIESGHHRIRDAQACRVVVIETRLRAQPDRSWWCRLEAIKPDV